MATIIGRRTPMSLNFHDTVEQTFTLAADFEALAKLSTELLTESYQTWYQANHQDATEDALTVAEFTVGGRTIETMREHHGQFFFQTLLVRAFEGYQAYLFELLATIYASLRAGMTLDPKAEGVVHGLMDDQLKTFDRGGQREKLIGELRGLGADPAPLHADQRRERLVGAVRNLVVHNRAVVNQRFADDFPDYPVPVGQPIVFDRAGVTADLSFLSLCVGRADAAAIAKFGLASEEIEGVLGTEDEMRAQAMLPPIADAGKRQRQRKGKPESA